MTNRLYKAIRSILDEDVLEDRSEYDTDQLMTMYDLTLDETTDLSNWIKGYMDLPVNFSKANPTVIQEYFEEADHNDWDGWDERHKATLYLLVQDLQRWVRSCKDQPYPNS